MISVILRLDQAATCLLLRRQAFALHSHQEGTATLRTKKEASKMKAYKSLYRLLY